jgi:predicted permease
MSRFVDDLLHAVRQHRRAPRFALLVISTLAIGIGGTTTAASLLYALVLRPVSAPNPHALVAVSILDRRGQQVQIPLSTTAEIGRRPPVESACAYTGGGLLSTEIDGRGIVLRSVEVVTPSYHEMMGVRPTIGRLFTNDDVTGGSAAPVTIISDALWLQQFGGASDVVGRTIVVEGEPLTIVGVTPPGFNGLRVEVAPALAITAQLLRRLSPPANPRAPIRSSYAIARLRRGVTLTQARADLEALWSTLPPEVTSANPGSTDYQPGKLVIESIATGFSSLRGRFSQPVQVLVALTALLLLLACVNLSGLALTRLALRQQEMSVRLALGASRWRLTCQLLLQTLVLALAGTAAAVPLVLWATRTLADHIWTGNVPMTIAVGRDAHLLMLMTGLGVAAAAIITIIPAVLFTQRTATHSFLRSSRVFGSHIGRLGKSVIAAQVAMSFVLLFANLLLVRTLANLHAIELGFDQHDVIAARLTARPGGYRGLDETTYYPDLVEQLAASPGVTAVALARGFSLPMIDPRPVARADAADKSAEVMTAMDVISPRFFETVRMPMVRGRDFTWHDSPSTAGVVIINRRLQELLFPNVDAIGRYIRIGTEPGRRSLEVIGIVGDARSATYRTPPGPSVYRPWLQERGRAPMVFLRGADESHLRRHLQQVVDALKREQFQRPLPMSTLVSRAFQQERVMAELSVSIATFTLVLTFIGIYGIQSYAATRRTPELGLRIALGASRPRILRVMLRDSLLVTTIGVAIGVPLALWSSQSARALLFGLSPFDTASLVVAIAVLLAIGTLAGWHPAHRASRADPVVVLRSE